VRFRFPLSGIGIALGRGLTRTSPQRNTEACAHYSCFSRVPQPSRPKNERWERILLPVSDIIQSIPILAFFPVLILVFINVNSLNGASVAILFLTMVWTMVFTLVGGLNIIPREIIAAAELFGLRGWTYFRKVLLPAMVPQLVTGSILAFAQGWNIIIVAEVLHTYIPHGTSAQDLFGIGSIMVTAAANGQNNVFLWAVLVMILAIAFAEAIAIYALVIAFIILFSF